MRWWWWCIYRWRYTCKFNGPYWRSVQYSVCTEIQELSKIVVIFCWKEASCFSVERQSLHENAEMKEQRRNKEDNKKRQKNREPLCCFLVFTFFFFLILVATLTRLPIPVACMSLVLKCPMKCVVVCVNWPNLVHGWDYKWSLCW